MGVETELFGIKNRGDGKEFRVVEKADGSIAVYAGDVALIEPGKIPVTATPSAQGVRKAGQPVNLSDGSGEIVVRGYEPTMVLAGDSWMAQYNMSQGSPGSISYDSATGILTVNRTAHGLYSEQEVFIGVTGRPDWCHYDLPITRVTADQFTVVIPKDLTSTPAAALVYIGNKFSTRAEHPLNWLQPSHFRVLRNGGVPDETAAQIRARFASLVALNPTVIDLRAGINDYAVTTPVRSAFADILWMCQHGAKKGAAILLHNVPPHGAPDAGRVAWITAINPLIATIPSIVPGVVLCDDYAALVDPAVPGTAKAKYLLADNLHLSVLGATALQQAYQAAMDKIAHARSILPLSPLESYDATLSPNGVFTFANGLLQTATGGTAFAPVTGAVAADLTVSATNMTSCAASVIPSKNGIGNAQRLVGAPASAGANMIVKTVDADTRVVAGQRYQPVCHIRTEGIPANAKVKNIALQMLMTVGGTAYSQMRNVWVSGSGSDETYFPQVDVDRDFVCEPILVPSAGTTDIRWQAMIEFNGASAGEVVFEVSQIGMNLVSV